MELLSIKGAIIDEIVLFCQCLCVNLQLEM